MELSLQTEVLDYAVVIRCKGRLISGNEGHALQAEAEKQTHLRKRVVLQLAEVTYIDSGGLGTLVRLFGVLRAEGGGLKLCQLSPFVRQVLQVTNLLGVIPTYESEREALAAFSDGQTPLDEISQKPRARIICLDSSTELLAYLKALLTRAGYEVFTTKNPSDARTLIIATDPRVVVYGQGAPAIDSIVEDLRHSHPKLKLVPLPADFSTAEASQAGKDLADRIRLALAN